MRDTQGELICRFLSLCKADQMAAAPMSWQRTLTRVFVCCACAALAAGGAMRKAKGLWRKLDEKVIANVSMYTVKARASAGNRLGHAPFVCITDPPLCARLL